MAFFFLFDAYAHVSFIVLFSLYISPFRYFLAKIKYKAHKVFRKEYKLFVAAIAIKRNAVKF